MTRASRPVVVAIVVAAVVLLATLGSVVVLRQLRAAATHPGTSTPAQPSDPTPEFNCGQGKCVSLATTSIGNETVHLVSDSQGRFGHLQIVGPNGPSVFSSNIAVLTANSLSCATGKVSACLLQGMDGTDTLGEIYVDRNGVWSATATPFSSDAGYLALRDVNGDGTPDVVTVQRRCGDVPAAGCTKVAIQVFQVTGDEMGCSVTYSSTGRLPGWPTVTPTAAQLRTCPS